MTQSVAQLCEADFKHYEEVIRHPLHAFNTAAFALLNKHKCEKVFALLFKDTKNRLGLLAGVKDGFLLSPFSAPFGGFSFLKPSVHLSALESAVELLEQFVQEKHLKGIRMILPPLIYSRVFLSKLINVFYRFGYKVQNMDLDFYIELQHPVPYEERLWKNARNHLKEALHQQYEVSTCTKQDDQRRVYDIIRENRLSKERPMYMALEEVLQTAATLPVDFFLVTKQGTPVAAAIVYHAAPAIPYVAFWGDVPGFSLGRPMNFLAYYLVQHYRKQGKQFLHLGISSEESHPNYGLSEFKESIGCTITPKLSFEKQLLY